MNAAWVRSALPAVIVPSAIGAERAADLRERFDSAGYARYGAIDRGSYDFVDDPPLDELAAILAGIASEVTRRQLAIASARVMRLKPGDYALVRDDRVEDDRPVELVLDLSADPVAAEVHWRHRGQVYFVMPSVPGSLALVERGPTVLANHTYVSKRATEVVRLRALLR